MPLTYFQSSFDRFLIKLLQFAQRHLPGCSLDAVGSITVRILSLIEYQTSPTSPELNHQDKEDVRSTMELRVSVNDISGRVATSWSMICRSFGSASQAATQFAIGAATGRTFLLVLSIQARISHVKRNTLKAGAEGRLE